MEKKKRNNNVLIVTRRLQKDLSLSLYLSLSFPVITCTLTARTVYYDKQTLCTINESSVKCDQDVFKGF